MLNPRPAERIDALDIVRGIALFGVLTVNLVMAFRVSVFAQFLPPETTYGLADAMVSKLVLHGFEMKAFALFSLLFGIGLGVQYEQLSKKGRPLYWLTRRLVILLGFGLIHLCLIWNGDILVEYALAGMLVMPLLAAPAWALATGAGCMLTLYLMFAIIGLPLDWPTESWLQQHTQAATLVYANGSLGQILRFNIAEIAHLLPLHIAVLPRTLGLFLLGAWFWRTGILRDVQGHRRALLATAFIGLAGGIALANFQVAEHLRQAMQNGATLLLAIGFGAAIVWLAESPRFKRMLGLFAPIGRMAFTNYLMQSLVFAFVFFGYGLGQFGQHGPALVFCFGVLFYILQCGFSTWWLRQYRYGPLEWLWRSLARLELQPMRKRALAAT